MTSPRRARRSNRYLGDDWALPALDESNRAFFTRGRIALRTCADCEAVQHPPQELCSVCQGTRFSIRSSKGVGSVHSRVVVHHAVHPSLADAVPYCVALIALDDVPEARIVGNVVDVPATEVQIGLRVRAVFEQVEDGGEALLIPQWEPLVSEILFGLNVVGAALVGLALWIGELPEDRKPFGPFTDVAKFLGFLDERTRQGRLVAWLRRRGFLE